MTKKKATNEDILLQKVDEIREFFKFGDEVIPFLGDLFIFLREVMPLMWDVSHSLQDTTDKLPKASERISDVSSTTELAANGILDKLDSITEKLNHIVDEADLEQKRKIDEINEDINDIIYVMQFQDITSQKLEHANRILEAIFQKFTTLFSSLEKARDRSFFGETMLSKMKGEDAEQQRESDSAALDLETEDKIHLSTYSQEDIDSLFGESENDVR